jgi:hypothetical protein
MPRTGDRRPGPGLRVLAKFVENEVCVVCSRGRSATASVGSVSMPHRSQPDSAKTRAAARSTSRAAAARCDADLRGLVDHGPVALIGMNTRVDARDVPPTTVIEDIEFVQAQVQRFAEAQLASA